MIARFTILLAVLLLSACAQQMTKQDFEQINNVAVVNCIKNIDATLDESFTKLFTVQTAQ